MNGERYSQKRVPGFGTERTVEEWAKDLSITQSLFQYYTETRGLTVEELYDLSRRKYVPPKQRKQRMSEAMLKTVERMRILLDVSGYGDWETWETIEVKRVGNNGIHAVSYLGKPLGTYKYRKGTLRLSSGQGLPLWDLDYEDAKIVQNAEGLWDLHPDTHAILRKRTIRPPAEDMKVLDKYNQEVEKAERNKPIGYELYEGFGKKYTCPQWAKVLGVPERTLRYNLKKGVTIEEFAARQKGENI